MINDCARFLALEKNENIVVTVHIMMIILMVVIILIIIIIIIIIINSNDTHHISLNTMLYSYFFKSDRSAWIC